MILIEELHQHVGTPIEGVFRLSDLQLRTDRFGRPYGYTVLEDRSGTLPVYAWRTALDGVQPLVCGNPVLARIHVRPFRGRLIGDADLLTQVDLPVLNPIQLVPHSELPNRQGAAQLQAFIEGCDPASLRRCLMAIFERETVAREFLCAPASQSHHHAYPGGLIDHSLEVASIVECTLVREEPAMTALARVAGLLHDIGKIRVLRADRTRTRAGYVLHHDVLTLELLAPGLACLDAEWPDGATALRYLLTWLSHARESRPLLPAALALQFADRYSSAADTRDQAFEGKPDWQRFARLEAAGPASRFWRPDATPVITHRLTRTERVTQQRVIPHGR